MVKWLFAHFSGYEATSSVVEAAAENGYIPVLEFLLAQDAELWSSVGAIRVKKRKRVAKGDKAVSQSIPASCAGRNVVHWHRRAILVAAKRGQFGAVRWLHKKVLCHYECEKEMDFVIRTHVIALDAGEFEIAELLIPQGKKPFDYAIHNPESDKVEVTLEIAYLRWDMNKAIQAIKDLASSDRLDLMQQIAMLHSPLPAFFCKADWLNASREAFKAACGRGDFSMMNWLMEYPIGHKACLLRTEGDLSPLRSAAQGNQVKVMKYLFDNGFNGRYGDTFFFVIKHATMSTLICLVGHMLSNTGDRIIEEAARYGRLDLLQYFHGCGCTLQNALITWRRRSWLRVIHNGVDVAAENSHLAVLKWLLNNDCGSCSTETMNVAAGNGHLHIVQWLHVNKSELYYRCDGYCC